MRRSFRKIHKWIFIFTGIFIVMWLITGMIMSMPYGMHWRDPNQGQQALLSASFTSQLQISPAQATGLVTGTGADDVSIRQIELKKIDGRIYYAVQDSNNGNHLVNAMTGEPYRLGMDVAENILRDRYKIKSTVHEKQTIENHGIGYIHGPLPIYRYQFEEKPSIWFHVNPANGEVMRSTWKTRVSSVSGYLHTFAPIIGLGGRDIHRWGTMVFIGIIALIGTITGLYLTLPVRRKRKPGS